MPKPKTLKLVAARQLNPWMRASLPGEAIHGRRIRVGLICDYLAIGGQERAILSVLKGMNLSCFEPFVYAFRGGALAAEVKALGIQLTLGSQKDPLSWIQGWTEEDQREKIAYREQLSAALRRDRIDAVLIFAWPDGIEAARRAEVPVLIERLDGPSLLAKVPDKSVFDKVICVSATIRTSLFERAAEFGLSTDRIELIYPGIDLERFNPRLYDKASERSKLGLRRGEIVIGYIGRLNAGKNVELLMRAVAKINTNYLGRSLRLLIMGPDDGALASLQALQAKYPLLKERVLFVGPHENVAPVMAALDVFAITSKSEGIPNVILEAMAMGLPIVSTNVGSVHEVIKRNGVLVPAPVPELVASCLLDLIKQRQLRKCMARNSLQLSRRFELRAVIRQYEGLIIDSLKRASLRN
jgi:glycosyltransferase involved in cell wall biosynthesis